MLALGYLASPAAFAPAYPAARAVAHRRHEPAQAIFGAAPDDDALSMQYAVDVPYKEAAYDPQAADAFYRARPAAVVRRVAQLAQLSGGFVLATLLDKKLDREEQMAEQRSEELLQLVTKLGPALYARAGPPNRALPNADSRVVCAPTASSLARRSRFGRTSSLPRTCPASRSYRTRSSRFRAR